MIDLVSYKQIVLKDDLDKELYLHHIKHFSQEEGTPFTVEPLKSIFGRFSETERGQEFIKGQIKANEITNDIYVHHFLTEIQRNKNDPPEIETNIGANRIKSTYKNWAEKTSTSPSGGHLGLYKAWLKVPEEKENTYNGLTSQQFFDIIGDMMAIAKNTT